MIPLMEFPKKRLKITQKRLDSKIQRVIMMNKSKQNQSRQKKSQLNQNRQRKRQLKKNNNLLTSQRNRKSNQQSQMSKRKQKKTQPARNQKRMQITRRVRLNQKKHQMVRTHQLHKTRKMMLRMTLRRLMKHRWQHLRYQNEFDWLTIFPTHFPGTWSSYTTSH